MTTNHALHLLPVLLQTLGLALLLLELPLALWTLHDRLTHTFNTVDREGRKRYDYKRQIYKPEGEQHPMNTNTTTGAADTTADTTSSGLEASTPPPPNPEALAEQLATAQRQNMELTARVLDLEQQNTRLAAPITDGSDSRFEPIWNEAMEIATKEGFCDEYDKIAAAMGGPKRSYEWNVTGTIRVEVTITVSQTYTASTDENAIEEFNDDLDSETVQDALTGGSITDWTVIDTSAYKD